jgi:hypothetical protein
MGLPLEVLEGRAQPVVAVFHLDQESGCAVSNDDEVDLALLTVEK